MKILIFSDGKYGDRAIKVVSKKFPNVEFVIIEERDPTMFLDEVNLGKVVEDKIDGADLLILYVRHPDVVLEICDHQKPTILPIHFGEGFFTQAKDINPQVVQPLSMCNTPESTGIKEVDIFFEKFGTPRYNLKLDYDIIRDISLEIESPCGASNSTLQYLQGKQITSDTFNNFAIAIRQECREPMTVLFANRAMAESSGVNHLLCLFNAIEKQNPSFLRLGTPVGDYIAKVRKEAGV